MQTELDRGTIVSTGTEAQQIFFHVCNSKKLKELPPTWNEIAASIRCESSTPVVPNARKVAELANKRRRWKMKKLENSDTFFWSGIQTLNSCCSLGYAPGNKSIIFFNDLFKPIEIYDYARKKSPFTSYSAAKHPKHSKFAITDMREKPVDLFFSHDTGVDFSSRNNFANSGSFAKVSFPVESLIP